VLQRNAAPLSQSVAACLRVSRLDSEIGEASNGKAQFLEKLGLSKTVGFNSLRVRFPTACSEIDKTVAAWNALQLAAGIFIKI
jgi:hypothetical protein